MLQLRGTKFPALLGIYRWTPVQQTPLVAWFVATALLKRANDTEKTHSNAETISHYLSLDGTHSNEYCAQLGGNVTLFSLDRGYV